MEVPLIELKVGEPAFESKTFGVANAYVEIEIHGEQPKLGGWSFAGVIAHTTDGNIVRPLPGVTLDSKYTTIAPFCFHCQKVRKRNESYIVRNDEGEDRQVGSSCLADFIGHANPHVLAKASELLAIAVEACEAAKAKSHGKLDATPNGPPDPKLVPYLDLKTFLAVVSLTIRENGWVSKKTAWQTRLGKSAQRATADTAFDALFDRGGVHPTTEDADLAEKTIAWAENLEDVDDEYLHNLKLVVGAGSGAFQTKQIGIVASAISAYQRAFKTAVGRFQRKDKNQWIGKVGDKVQLSITLTAKTPFQKYGGGLVLTFLDRAGNTIKTFVGKNLPDDLKIGEEYFAEATIQKLDTWNGENQNIVKQLRLLSPVTGSQP